MTDKILLFVVGYMFMSLLLGIAIGKYIKWRNPE